MTAPLPRDREPGRHIDGVVRANVHHWPEVPVGWTAEAYALYAADPDGGLSPVRPRDEEESR